MDSVYLESVAAKLLAMVSNKVWRFIYAQATGMKISRFLYMYRHPVESGPCSHLAVYMCNHSA
jgi:hypothetical protein